MTDPTTGSCLVQPEHRPQAQLRVACIPHAGAGVAAYASLARLAPPWLEVCVARLPGRETRLDESPHLDVGAMASEIADDLDALRARPLVLLGHSMGALVAFETARMLPPETQVVHLFVSGRRAPHLEDDDPPLHPLPDDEFVAELQARYDGIPKALLDAPDLLALVLPTIRADCQALETYEYRRDPVLDIPISAFGGAQDPRVDEAELDAWAHVTTGEFARRTFAGAHFYFQGREQALIGAMIEDLERARETLG